MKHPISPSETSRAEAFNLWMSSPMPMVTLVKTLDVTKLLKYSRRHNESFNMLLCWCICRAAREIREFYILPEKGELFCYDSLAVNVIVNNKKGGISSCDIPYDDDFQSFAEEYHRRTTLSANDSKSIFLEDRMVIGTSAVIGTELDCIVNQYTDLFCNPMVMWGKYRKGWFKTTLPVSFQFHHVQMDGGHGASFLEALQKEISRSLRIDKSL